MARKNNEVLQGIRVGDRITADFLNRITTAINRNTTAVAAPTQKTVAGGQGEGVADNNTSWTAGASDITDETVQLTDSNGDTTDVERITVIVFTNDATGETMTLNISYT